MAELPEAGVPAVDDHAFNPRGEWWSLCRTCGLAEASHSITTCAECGFRLLPGDGTKCAPCTWADPTLNPGPYDHLAEDEFDGLVCACGRRMHASDTLCAECYRSAAYGGSAR